MSENESKGAKIYDLAAWRDKKIITENEAVEQVKEWFAARIFTEISRYEKKLKVHELAFLDMATLRENFLKIMTLQVDQKLPLKERLLKALTLVEVSEAAQKALFEDAFDMTVSDVQAQEEVLKRMLTAIIAEAKVSVPDFKKK